MESFYFNFFKKITSKILLLLFVGCFFSNNTLAQIVPTEGATECFVAGNGGVFIDNGGTVTNPVNTEVGNEGDYFNCGCETVTTLCSPDGSAITLDFTTFDVFATFDFVEIYDGDNTSGTLLFDNGAGGINAGDETLAEMITSSGSSSFTGSTGCITVLFFATAVVSDFGWEANITVASGATHPGDNLPCGTNLNCLAPPNIMVNNITNNSADVTWMVADSADSYNIEYGEAGFALGTGTMDNTTNTIYNITGLTQNTDYQFYIQSDCGGGEFSNNAGPFPFTTLLSCPAPDGVTVTNITPTTADVSWNMSFGAIGYNVEYGEAGFALGTGTIVNSTMPNTTITGLMPETSYEFYVHADCDPDVSNNAVVNSFMTIETCPAPVDIVVSNLGPSSVDISWTASFGAIGYNIEYGSVGFALGTGTVLNTTMSNITITGLNQNTAYEFYVIADCDTEVSDSPVNSFNTTFNNPCNYTIEMFDSFGDGWNGSDIVVTVGCIATEYTFTTGDEATFTINSGANLPMTFTYSPGTFEGEVTFNILDDMNNVIYSDGPNPTTGTILELYACPTCAGPSDVMVDEAFGESADLSWTASAPTDTYLVEYGPTGFLPGSGTTANTSDPFISLTGLNENTDYDFYVSSLCMNGDTSGLGCPDTFKTIALNDVGIVAISSPLSGCGLTSSEVISVTMQNFGANPQALIPFFYSINGQPAGITIPLDGYFTNVIGKDSMVVLDFEATADLSQPGEYVIAAWTELENDSDISNDTTFFTISNIPLVDNFPFAQDFESGDGGWSVSDDSQNSTWDFGTPSGTEISEAASGVNAWVTNLGGDYVNNELSFVVSNCFDFSSLSVDPDISFSLQHETETNWDGGWLDISIDGGNTWEKVGTLGSGNNWYNNNIGVGDVWSGNSGGWVFAKHTLFGAAGESDVRLRFAFDSDGSVSGFDGIGFDNIWITTPEANDLGAQAVVKGVSTLECGDPNEQVTMTFVNNGTATQSNFDVSYQVNGGMVFTETVNLTLAPNESGMHTFANTFNSTGTGVFNITAWTDLVGEVNFTNDTITTSFSTFQVLPFREDFEGMVLPEGWSSDEFTPVNNTHNNISYVAFDNLFNGDTNFELVSPPIGPIGMGDSLSFDYRYVNFVTDGIAATNLGADDSLQVQISTDCGMSYSTIFTVTEANHISTNELATVRLDLAPFVGQGIKIQFLATWGSGDYYIDLDNINVFQCVPLNLTTEANMESLPDAGDGTASVATDGDRGPYTYEWDFGATTSSVTDLGGGTYTVTVTDVYGCFETAEVTVDIGVKTKDLEELHQIKLFPNPTIDVATLDMTFSKSVDVQVHVINTIGQVLFETSVLKTTQEQLNLDLQNFPNGMYFVRIKVDDRTLVKKLMKGQP